MMQLVENLADAVENGSRDQHADSLVFLSPALLFFIFELLIAMLFEFIITLAIWEIWHNDTIFCVECRSVS